MNFQRRIVQRTLQNIQRRNAGGYLRKNIAVEENAGLRESSYKTWSFTPPNIAKLVFAFAIPTTLVYFAIVGENGRRDKQVGSPRLYGISPFGGATK